MANLSTLTIQLDGNSAKLVKELAKAQKKTNKFGKNMRRQVNAAAKSFAVMGAAAAAAMAVVVKSSLSSIDALAKTADKLGVTTEGLAGLRHAAEQTGVASNQLDMGLQRMTRRIAEAAQGTGEAKAALAELGLNAKAMAKLPLDVQFQKVAGAMSQVESQSDKIRLGFKLFDSEGVNLINTLKVGEEGLQGFAQEAVELGLAVSRIDAAKVEAANNAIGRAKGAAEGLGNKLTVELAPYIEEVATQFVDAMKNGEDMGERVTAAIDFVADAVAFTADAVHGLQVVFKALKAAALTASEYILKGYSAIGKGIDTITGTMLEAIASVMEAGAVLPDWAGGELFAGAADSIKGVRAGLAETTAGISKFADEVAGYAATARTELHDMAMQELPSVGINKYKEELKAAAQARAEIIAQTANAAVQTPDSVETAITAPSNADFQAALDERLQMQIAHTEQLHSNELEQEAVFNALKLENQALTDAALLEMATEHATATVNAEWEAKQAALGETGQALTVDEELQKQREISELALGITSEMAQKRAAIEAEQAKTIEKYDLTTFKGKANTLSATLGLMGSFGKKSEKLQKAALLANKAIAIKDSIVAITGGIAKALNNPYPANLAFAAQVAAQGAGLMSTLSSVGGGGGGADFSSSSGGSTTPSYASNNVADDEEVQQRQTQSSVQVHIAGNLHADEDYLWNKVIPGIQEAVKERDVVFIDADTRQAEELALA